MEFNWSPDQADLAEKTFRFAQEELNAGAAERDASRQFSIQEWKKCGEFGLLGAPISREFGGLGLDALTTARMFEAFGKGCRDSGLGFSAGAHLFACVIPIAYFASPAVKELFLPELVSGIRIGANAITERDAGSDISSLKTRAEKTGDVYRISGEKTFVTNGPVADVMVVYASTKEKAGFFGTSAFVVECNSRGISAGPALDKTGLRTSPTSSFCFDNCVVPASNRLGAEGQGSLIFQLSMNWERTCLFAFWVGVMERQLEEVIAHGRDRIQFGNPIGTNQAVSHRIANMKLRLESARLLLYRACWEAANGHFNPLNVSLAKLAVSEAAVQTSLDCLQIFGGSGVLTETGIERYLRDSVGGTIYSGTSEMQKEIIARHLGLPSLRKKA